jgi:hypothetical protein
MLEECPTANSAGRNQESHVKQNTMSNGLQQQSMKKLHYAEDWSSLEIIGMKFCFQDLVGRVEYRFSGKSVVVQVP